MSYIRTKDGRIVDTSKYPEHPASWSVQASDYALTINQADTIEELCDGVIEKCLSGNRFHYIWDFNKQDAMEVMNIDINKGYKEFYFGIFVNHNNKIDFISVAKMNENGELELI